MSRDALARARAALERHRPELSTAALDQVGGGLDNTVFRVGDLTVRVGDPTTVAREADLLRTVALGSWLRRLHAVDTVEVPALPHEGDDPADRLDDLTGPAELLAVVRDTVPATGPHRVLVHNDLGAEHLLEGGGALTGVIDWTDAAVSDPAVDFARPLRDFGPAFLARVLAAYGGAPDGGFGDRVRFLARCAALEDLAYGAQPGREAYRGAAAVSLRWLFPGPV
jgi:aminoglycoside phosphotransferase (APT) family kinase protein